MLKEEKSSKSHNGWVKVFSHQSTSTQTPMKFSVFLPSGTKNEKLPVAFWLSGLTCTEDNFINKAGAQRYAEELGLVLVCPDTSPRGAGIEGEADHWDFGLGAGFYLNATSAKWSRHYRMYDYVCKELYQLVGQNFPTDMQRCAIMGHSMGGHGALVIGLRNPDKFHSISAFSPISAPCQCPWGQKAFTHYLGPDQTRWQDYDASVLLQRMKNPQPILVDQGTDDQFLTDQLKPHELERAAEKTKAPLRLRYQPGYDHSYYFISTFIADHLQFHREVLAKRV